MLIFPRFIASNWKDFELPVCWAMPNLLGVQQKQIDRPQKSLISCPESWQQHILESFELAPTDDDILVRCSIYLHTIEYMTIDRRATERILQIMNDMIEDILCSPAKFDQRTVIALGAGLEFVLNHGIMSDDRRRRLWPPLCLFGDYLGTIPLYLENLLRFCEVAEVDCSNASTDTLVSILAKNLASSVHLLRYASLRLLSVLFARARGRNSDILQTALIIENTPLNLETARSVSMHVRDLSTKFKSVSDDSWLNKSIPHFCFGLLTFKLSQLWTDAVSVLRTICETKISEEIVAGIAFDWIENTNHNCVESSTTKTENPPTHPPNEYECSELSRVGYLAQQSREELNAASSILQKTHCTRHMQQTLAVPDAASRALRVLSGIPHIAEKRSRRLVPIFLQWASTEQNSEIRTPAREDQDGQSGSYEVEKLSWKDRRAILDLFSLFVNPRVLFRSAEVFNSLLGLLTNGDVQVQKSALKAIFTWKIESVQPYEENLLNILDDSRFREEISVFLQVEEQESVIQKDHRPGLMPILLRILYGRIITRSGSTGSGKGQATKRKAVFEAISRFSKNDLREFVSIALGSLVDFDPQKHSLNLGKDLPQNQIGPRKQYGLVNMMNDMLDTLGNQLAFLTRPIVNAVSFCLLQSAEGISTSLDVTVTTAAKDVQLSLIKSVRQVGLNCLTLLFKHCSLQDLQPCLPVIFDKIINPRLEKLPIETAQSISGMLQLFSVWASSPESSFFLSQYNSSLLYTIIDCLNVPSAKDEVKVFVIDRLLKKLIELVDPLEATQAGKSNRQLILAQVLSPNIDYLLERTGALLRTSPSKDLLSAMISLISLLAPNVTSSSQIENLLDVSTFLLDQPSQRVSPKTKGDLLRIIQRFVPLIQLEDTGRLHQHLYQSVSSLFGYFKDRTNRVILSEVLVTLAQDDAGLRQVADLCIDLNSFSTRSVDEPDFEKRLRAYNSINESMFLELSPQQWKPLLYNMLFYIKNNEELAIRSNASFTIQRFIQANSLDPANERSPSFDLLKQVLLPALRNGAFEKSELVRSEYLAVMAQLINRNPDWSEVNDMVVLLVDNDEEASFFTNILHIQQHRRLRALRRLATDVCKGYLKSTNIAHFLIPIIEHFIFDRADDDSAHNLAAEAIKTIGALAGWLEWPQLRAMFRRYSGYILSKSDLEKTIIKLIGVVIDAIGTSATIKQNYTILELENTVTKPDERPMAQEDMLRNTLSTTMPSQEKLAEDLIHNFLPPLTGYLHDKDESTVSLRVPVAISIVKLLGVLPPERLTERLPPVLTDVCHILRSRAQESRDMTRKTLVEISTLIGPSCFGFILKELRSSLARGYQLHVLSYTVHSILVATASIFKPGDLDYCLPQIVSIIMDDIFGVTGQEKDADEYISKMKEVKSSKSYDSMELLAKTATITHLVHLIRPLQALMEEKMDLQTIRKVDELLRRIGTGLLRNDAAQSRELLMFCYEVIRDVYKNEDTKPKLVSRENYRVKRFLLNSKDPMKRGSTSSYKYKLARFALDILRTVLHKYNTLQTPSNISGLMPTIEEALFQAHEEVQISVFRLLATIIKVPIRHIDDNGTKYVTEAVKIIRDTTSTSTEIAQAALKMISAILHERQEVAIKETQIAYLLKRLRPDLEEPDRQGVTFNFLKAVLTRKIIITEVYEVLDIVAAMMVTNHTRSARDLARSVYFQFIINYPQTKERLKKQLGFLVKNLDYKHVEGRQSVMEAIHLLISKLGSDIVQDLVGSFFAPLTMVIVNDESPDCRQMAGELLKELFQRADGERIQTILSLLRTWLNQDEQDVLSRVALQIYSIYLDTQSTDGEKEISLLQDRVIHLLKTNVADTNTADWELLYFALQIISKICQRSPNTLLKASSAILWVSIRKCLSFPHAWVKLLSAKLLGICFADFARANANRELSKGPIKSMGGLRLDSDEISEVAKASIRSLRFPGVSEELATQSVRNLIFLGRFVGLASITPDSLESSTWEGIDDDERDEDENSDVESSVKNSEKSILVFVFERASAILRREPLNTKAASLIPKTASLQLIAALCHHTPIPELSTLLETILLPLHNLTDSSIPAPYSSDEGFRTAYQALISSSQEIMASLQKKIGTTQYINRLSRVREGVKERREGRRIKRRLEAVAEPEKVGTEKRKKGEKKRMKRKERSGEERGRRRGW